MHQNVDIVNLAIHSVLLGNFTPQKFLKNPVSPCPSTPFTFQNSIYPSLFTVTPSKLIYNFR